MPSRTISRPSSTTITTFRSNVQPQSIREFSLRSQLRQHPHMAVAPIQLPFRSKMHTTAVQQADVESAMPILNDDAISRPPSMLQASQNPPILASNVTTIDVPEAQESSTSKPLVLSKSLQELLPALNAQTPHYITAHVHSFPYLLTEGDTLRLPFHMHGVTPGDILRFNRATLLGSRDFTLKAGYSSPQHTSPPHVRGEAFINKRRTGEPNYIDERLFECRMRVMGVDSGPMFLKEKKKRRIRRTKRVTSKHKYTVLKVMEVRIRGLDELMSLDGQQVVLE